jgi:hypothetical protein
MPEVAVTADDTTREYLDLLSIIIITSESNSE